MTLGHDFLGTIPDHQGLDDYVRSGQVHHNWDSHDQYESDVPTMFSAPYGVPDTNFYCSADPTLADIDLDWQSFPALDAERSGHPSGTDERIIPDASWRRTKTPSLTKQTPDFLDSDPLRPTRKTIRDSPLSGHPGVSSQSYGSHNKRCSTTRPGSLVGTGSVYSKRLNEKANEKVSELEHLYKFGVDLEILQYDSEFVDDLFMIRKRFGSLSIDRASHGHAARTPGTNGVMSNASFPGEMTGESEQCWSAEPDAFYGSLGTNGSRESHRDTRHDTPGSIRSPFQGMPNKPTGSSSSSSSSQRTSFAMGDERTGERRDHRRFSSARQTERPDRR
ncbi:hypothetical protein B0I35DRAFT_444207 [Stachybotrys elegans]|uniref:Uncharacterized protein n=1 Tax=Stachybotrys elegans TaxID=80388 RepID=A0A8K0SFZ7_9HYPO|nr:hypothetical protein B0I35DRAFT_444207 [Stachybotrys elegans]